jgi:uncharacterized membrane protein YjjP (DUF1212 family)
VPPAADRLQEFVLELGRALSLAGTPVSETRQRLARVAAAGGTPGVRVVALPTALLISAGPDRPTTIESVPLRTGALRLDQVSALYELTRQAERGAVEPAAGLRRLREIRVLPPRHGRAVALLGHTLMTVGLCLILQPTPPDVAVAAVFGAAVGSLVLLSRGRDALSVLVPVGCAIAVSAGTFESVQHGIADPGLRTLIAPLVTFLPGGALTTATVELASGEMVAGSSRLVSGMVQLLLLAFGIVAGAELAGLPPATVLRDRPVNLLGWWAPWLGVVVFGIATALYFSAPRGALRWLLLVLLTAWVGEQVGGRLVGPDTAGFFGALAMTPVALAVARLPGGPPAQVTFLPAFWLLVPGALGLVGVTEAVGDPAGASRADLAQPLASVIAIALGVLCGTTVRRGRTARRLIRHLRAVWRGPGGGAASVPRVTYELDELLRQMAGQVEIHWSEETYDLALADGLVGAERAEFVARLCANAGVGDTRAILTLGHLDAVEALPMLRAAAAGDEPWAATARRAMVLFGRGAEVAAAVARDAVHAPARMARVAAVLDLPRIGGPVALAALEEALADEDYAVRSFAWNGLVEALDLDRHLRGPDGKRAASTEVERLDVLISSDLPAFVRMGVAAMRDLTRRLRAGATPESLGIAWRPEPDVFPALRRTLFDTEAPYPVAAIEPLDGVDRRWAETIIAMRLEQQDVRAPAALARLGATWTVPALTELAASPDSPPDLREAASRAVRAMS